MEMEYFEDYNISKKGYIYDIQKSEELRAELKKEEFRQEDYNINDLIYSPELSEAQNIRNKFALKNKGKKLRDDEKDYYKAISYFESLLDNPYFENDYYVYRQLAILYGKRYTKQYEKQLDIVKRFLKSGIYCSLYLQMWFDKILSDLGDEYITQDEIDKLMDYFLAHGNKNKDIENSPVILAERIFFRWSTKCVDIHNQFEYEKDQILQELDLIGTINKKNYKFLVDFFTGVLEHTRYRQTFIYKHLISGYEGLGDYDNMLIVLSLFFKNGYNLGPRNQKWFDKRIKIVNKKLNKSYTKMDLKKLNSVVELAEIDRLSIHSKINVDQKLVDYELLFNKVDEKLNENGSLSKEEFESIKEHIFSHQKIDSANLKDQSLSNQNTITNEDFNKNGNGDILITVSNNNLFKLLKSDIGDLIIAERGGKSIKMRIVEIENQIFIDSPENNKLNISNDNFDIIQSLNLGDLVTIKNKGNPGSATLEILDK